MNRVEATDEQLVAQSAKGDRAAFSALVARHQRRLLALATRTLGNRAAADDVVQEAFTRAWINAPSFVARGGGNFGPWLSRVALNLSIDQIRKRRQVALDDIDDPVDPAAGAETGIMEQQMAARVRAAVAKLPERQRIAISLTYDSELSNSDGAAAMGTTVGAFELLLVRARKSLRLALKDGPPQ